ncbi:MAG: hypothetical protein E7527_04795 [Ruminococcaceae bacterium]|nr:hypothetical protein [Oscillospiraceae bacterium]
MQRTTTRRGRELKRFITDNRRLFPFVGLFLLGAAVGVAVYVTLLPRDLAGTLSLRPVATGIGGWLSALWNSLFATLALLTALFLLGLWGCGAPFILLIPLLHGLGLGLTEAHYYARGLSGVLATAGVVLPVGLLTGAVLASAGAESLRLSVGVSRRLVSGDTEEGLRDPFRLYSLRFLLFLAGAVAVSILDVLLRAALPQLL